MTDTPQPPAFSASDAALEGFRLAGRRWRVALGWGGFNVLAWVAMIMVSAVVLLVLVFALGEQGSSAAAGWVGGGVYLVGLMVIGAVLSCGVFRLMLRPEEPAFLHLRLGADELRYLALAALMMFLAGAVVLAGVGLSWLARPVGLWLQVVAVMLSLAVALWLFLRISLALPWTFDVGRFVVAPAWRATRGRGWALVGMWLLNACLVAMTGLALWLAMFLVTGLATGFEGLFSSLSNAERMEVEPGRYLLQLMVQVALGPLFGLLATAPYVAAYRSLVRP